MGFTVGVLLESSADGPVHRIQYQEDDKIHCWQAAAESAVVAVALAGVVEVASAPAPGPLQFEKTEVVETRHYIHMASPPSS